MSTFNNSTNSNQQTLTDSGANERPPMLEKRNYILWESRFRRFLYNKLKNRERMWNSIQNGPYQRPMVVNPTNPTVLILEPLSKMTEDIKKQYIADVRVMNYLLQAISNDIYNLVDTCKSAKEMWERIKRLMHGSEITTHLVQFEPHVLASRGKKSAKNHDPLALVAYSNGFSSHSHANSSYSPQPYYVTHPLSVIDYDDEYQWELQGDSQEDKLTSAMMMVELTYKPRMQVMVKMLTRIKGETKLKGLIQEMQVMKAIRLFSVFHELSLLQPKQMFEKVLNEVKLRMFERIFLKKPPLLGELDQYIMKAYKREISKRLSQQQQMRRWEYFVNGRPILPTMKRL
uniref:Integrase, catalytic region, zinc finger, CCHC-type, peptidase aspartic, catalytic n=1 Tax=Tanacetum cinerariifolium TaxID=118510 RepID=A0A6L2P1Q9_TANCI|nr:hypothetical protein [Tanacetum cinerariifolium]